MLSASETPLTSQIVSSKSSSVQRFVSNRPVGNIYVPSTHISSLQPSHYHSINPSSLDLHPGHYHGARVNQPPQLGDGSIPIQQNRSINNNVPAPALQPTFISMPQGSI